VEGTEQPHHNDFVYALKDEKAYLQADDEKPEIVEPFDPASIVCQFCGKSLACDLTRRACWLTANLGRRRLVAMVSRSGGFRGLARLLPGLGGWLLDRWVTHGRSRAAAPGPAWGAPEGFRRSRWRAQCAQQSRKLASNP
jgi:hypothetical protein